MKRIGIWIVQVVSLILGIGFCGYDTIKITSRMSKKETLMSGLDVWFGESDIFDKSEGVVIFSFALVILAVMLVLELIIARETKTFAFVSFVLAVVLAILMFMGATSFMVNPTHASYDAFTSLYKIEITPICIGAGIAFLVSAFAAFAQAFTSKN